MKTPIAYLKEIAKRRKLKTERFNARKWQAMSQKDVWLADLWHGFEIATATFITSKRCFSCGKPSRIAVEPHGELFCSQACSTEYGIVKGQA